MEGALHEIKKEKSHVVGRAFKLLSFHPPTLQTSIYLSTYVLRVQKNYEWT